MKKSPLLFILFFFLCSPLWSSWYFNAQIRLRNCPAGAGAYVPSLPSLGPFPTKSLCENTRNMVAAIRVSYRWCANWGDYGCTSWQTCVVDYSISACSGSDDTSTFGAAFGSTDLSSNSEGKPFLSSHYTFEFGQWISENRERVKAQHVLSSTRKIGKERKYSDRQVRRIDSSIPAKTEEEKAYHDKYFTESDYFYRLSMRQTGPEYETTAEDDKPAEPGEKAVSEPSEPDLLLLSQELKSKFNLTKEQIEKLMNDVEFVNEYLDLKEKLISGAITLVDIKAPGFKKMFGKLSDVLTVKGIIENLSGGNYVDATGSGVKFLVGKLGVTDRGKEGRNFVSKFMLKKYDEAIDSINEFGREMGLGDLTNSGQEMRDDLQNDSDFGKWLITPFNK